MSVKPALASSIAGYPLDPKCFGRLAGIVTRELGIQMPPNKASMLQSRLLRRLRALNLGSFEEYEQYLLHAPADSREMIHFLDLVTTNKTDFFREPAHFQFLTSRGLPQLARDWNCELRWNCKVWSAGCSTGEEVYTLAMLLSEYSLARPGFTFSILGTDVSTRVLEHACTAIYPESLVEPVPMDLRKKYLLRSKDRSERLVRIDCALRRAVRFGRLNFMDPDYRIHEEFDSIFFRNVLIYFDRQTQEKVVNRICRYLRPGGYFFISHSESLSGLKVPLKALGNSIFQKVG